MRSSRRLGILVAALVVLVAGFFVARGAADEETAQSPATTARETGGEPHRDAAPRATPPPAPRVERLRLRDGAPAGAVRTLRYEDGDTVRLRFTSNVADEVHVHGVDRYVDVPAGGTASTRFAAPGEGIFEIESHTTGELIARLEVR